MADSTDMLEAVYLDTVEEKSIVALRPKPVFQALFQVATTKEDGGVVLYPGNEEASGQSGSCEDDAPCLWWRRGRVELHLNTYLADRSPATGLIGVELLAA